MHFGTDFLIFLKVRMYLPIFANAQLRVPIAAAFVVFRALLAHSLQFIFSLELMLVETLEDPRTDKDVARGNDYDDHVDVQQ